MSGQDAGPGWYFLMGMILGLSVLGIVFMVLGTRGR
jgi:hypothetical protein